MVEWLIFNFNDWLNGERFMFYCCWQWKMIDKIILYQVVVYIDWLIDSFIRMMWDVRCMYLVVLLLLLLLVPGTKVCIHTVQYQVEIEDGGSYYCRISTPSVITVIFSCDSFDSLYQQYVLYTYSTDTHHNTIMFWMFKVQSSNRLITLLIFILLHSTYHLSCLASSERRSQIDWLTLQYLRINLLLYKLQRKNKQTQKLMLSL